MAKEIASKDPLALKATKEGYRFSLEMSWDASMSFTSAKEFELVARQNDAWRTEGIGGFPQGRVQAGPGIARPQARLMLTVSPSRSASLPTRAELDEFREQSAAFHRAGDRCRSSGGR